MLFIISSCLITVICYVITRVRARDAQCTSARRPARARAHFLSSDLRPHSIVTVLSHMRCAHISLWCRVRLALRLSVSVSPLD